MSHFTVLVIHGEDESVDDILAPFQENTGEPNDYLEFQPEFTKEEAEHDRIATIEKMRRQAEETKNEADANEYAKYKDLSLEEFMSDWHGYRFDADVDAYGYMTNPNSKWDWYTIGGRWTGYFKLKDKPGVSGQLGQSGTGNNAPTFDADIVRKGDIDFDAMRKDAESKAENRWEVAHSVLKDLPPTKSFEQLQAESTHEGKVAGTEDYWKEIRQTYWDQPACKAWKDSRQLQDLFGWGGSPDFFFKQTKDEFVKEAGESSFVPFAILKDGEWHEKGSMGWFATVSDEKDQALWNKQVQEIMANTSDDMIFTLVDCHI